MKIDKEYLQILNLLRKNPSTSLELASLTGMNQRSINYRMRVLLDMKFIKKNPNLQDLRSFTYSITELGEIESLVVAVVS